MSSSQTSAKCRASAHSLDTVVHFGLVLACLLVIGCRADGENSSDPLFERIDPSHTNIHFINALEYQYEFNIYRYRNFYNGAGVAIGDVNNDGLKDIFLVGNQVPNRLYLNNGDFRFTDISDIAGISGARAWSTGVTMADVNGDGWLDIYVSNSGIVSGDDKKNELYINNGDSTFTERAQEYGIADEGLSIHATFLDFDKDGDLDMYLVNNSFRHIGDFNIEDNTRHIPHRAGGDRLFRNERSEFTPVNERITGPDGTSSPANESRPYFTDVTERSGIYSSEIGFGLGVSVGDVNRDGWPDMYISNDFFERDYLYINNQDGTFEEMLENTMKSVSAAAMGADMVDINGDGYPEIFVTDMLPLDEYRLKTVTSFDSWDRYQNYVKDDYYHQFTRNTLQLNRGSNVPAKQVGAGNGTSPAYFSEVGRMSGVEASDWSWGALIADFDLDGARDLFVANGIYQDLTNADYLVQIRDEATMNELIDGNYVDFKRLIDMIPSNRISNFMAAGTADLQFTDVTAAWGLSEPSFSNGAAYGDLDNDGDLDLVVSNVHMDVFVYRNRATELHPDRAWLQVNLQGPSPNTFAVGAQVTAWSDDRLWYVEQQPVRGFQSTVDHTLHLGLGSQLTSDRLDSLVVQWPSGRVTTLQDVEVNQRLTLRYSDRPPGDVITTSMRTSDAKATEAHSDAEEAQIRGPFLQVLAPAALGLDWRHRENAFNDFTRHPLLFHMRSTEGPPMCVGDLNGDGREDLYVGGAKDQPGAVFVQNNAGRFDQVLQRSLENDRVSEDVDCVWFDADGDGDLDLYVGSGGSEFPSSSSALIDRLYLNEGGSTLVRSDQLFISTSYGFEPTGAVAAADFDGDGDVDLFVGTRMRPFAYGLPVDAHLLINDGVGNFEEMTDSLAPELRGIGMVTGARWADIDGDGDLDLVVAGEWMPLTLFENDAGQLVNRTREAGLEATSGWWNGIEVVDLDGDGDLDLIGANHGLNSRFRARAEEPVEIWISDFDRNGTVEQVLTVYNNGGPYPMALKHDLIDQIPSLIRRFPTYESYAGQSIHDVFPEEQLRSAVHLQATLLQSVVAWNDGEAGFRVEPLPFEAQLAPMYGIKVIDFDSDGRQDIFMGGNLYETKPEVGRYDASYGVVTTADRSELQTLPFSSTGFWVDGQVRRIETIQVGGRQILVVARNNDTLNVFAPRVARRP